MWGSKFGAFFDYSHSDNNLVELAEEKGDKVKDDEAALLEGGLARSASVKLNSSSIKTNLIRSFPTSCYIHIFFYFIFSHTLQIPSFSNFYNLGFWHWTSPSCWKTGLHWEHCKLLIKLLDDGDTKTGSLQPYTHWPSYVGLNLVQFFSISMYVTAQIYWEILLRYLILILPIVLWIPISGFYVCIMHIITRPAFFLVLLALIFCTMHCSIYIWTWFQPFVFYIYPYNLTDSLRTRKNLTVLIDIWFWWNLV